MSILTALKLAATLITLTVVGVALLNPAFHFGTFITGIITGGYLLLLTLENSAENAP